MEFGIALIKPYHAKIVMLSHQTAMHHKPTRREPLLETEKEEIHEVGGNKLKGDLNYPNINFRAGILLPFEYFWSSVGR